MDLPDAFLASSAVLNGLASTPILRSAYSLATNSGAASVSAMKPSLAPFTSGPAACAKAPDGNCACAAPSSAAVPALAFRNPRRLMPLFRLLLVIVSVILWFETLLLTPGTRWSPDPQKNRSPKSALSASPGQRRCLRPVIGPDTEAWFRRRLVPYNSSVMPARGFSGLLNNFNR